MARLYVDNTGVRDLTAMETAAEPIVEKRRGEPIATAFDKAESSVAVASGQETAPAPVPEIVAPEPTSRPRLVLRPRHKRHALFAASVAIAAAFGAVVGAAATGAFSKPAAVNVAGEENKAIQQSVAHLSKELTSLKASLEAANKSAHSQIAKRKQLSA